MKKKSQPAKQHIFPEMFLKGFTDEKGFIFMFDSHQDKISDPRNTESIARQKHIYTVFKKNEKDYTVEEKFSKIESRAASLFKQINEFGFHHISNDDVLELVNFCS